MHENAREGKQVGLRQMEISKRHLATVFSDYYFQTSNYKVMFGKSGVIFKRVIMSNLDRISQTWPDDIIDD